MDGLIPVIRDVSFAVSAGERVGIVGESGCGKTVTGLSLLRLFSAQAARLSGEIRFEGRDLATLSARQMRDVRGRDIAMIFQEPMSALDPVFTVGDQISEAYRTHFPVSRKEGRERAIAALTEVGIPAPARRCDEYPHQLSGGMLISALAPWVSPYVPTAQDFNATMAPLSAEHWLGADDLGRDTLSRLIYGGTASLYASFLAVAVAIVIGVPVGLLAGYLGGWVDEVISRIIDSFLSFPAIVLAIAVTGALGIGLTNGMISVGIVFAPQLARLVRARTLVVRHELYVDSARCFGASTGRILWRHVLPNTIQPVIVQVTLLLAGALLAEASLSFLGLGIQPPNASWGAMLARAYQNMRRPRTGRTWWQRRRALCASFASMAWRPTFRSFRRCWRTRISSPTASAPISSIRMLDFGAPLDRMP